MIENLYPGEIPIGSIEERKTNIIGRGGSIRHSGSFSDSNPYYQQLQYANKNQDMDALYERAVEWESDQANYLQQLDTNRKILEEQRTYDLPENEIRRMREAGINPDIQGSSGSGSGSGSSSSMAVPSMADQAGQTKFSNSYDNLNNVLNVANTINSFVSSASGIMSNIATFQSLPSQISLNKANARLSNAQASEVNSLLDGKVEAQSLTNKGLTLSNISSGLRNSTDILKSLASLSDLISPDSDDPSIISTLKGLGLSEDESTLGSYKDIIKQFHSNPAKRASYLDDKLAERVNQEREEQYTPAVISEFITFEKRQARMDANWQYNVSSLESKVAEMLNNDDYATSRADLEQELMSNANVSADIEGELLLAEFDSMEQKLNIILDQAVALDKEIQSIKDHPRGVDGKHTSFELQRIEALELQKSMLLSSGAAKYEQVFDIIDEIQRQTATFDSYYNLQNGKVKQPRANTTLYNQETFNSIYDRRMRGDEVALDLGKKAVDIGVMFLLTKGAGAAARGAGAAAGAAAGGKAAGSVLSKLGRNKKGGINLSDEEILEMMR